MTSPASAPGSPTLKVAAACVLIAGMVIFGWNLTASWPFTVDDAFIVFRYARNLATFGEPTMNVGEAPVEGVSQVAWLAMLTLPHWLGVDVVLTAKVMALGLMLLMFVGAGALAVRLTGLAGAPRASRLFAAAVTVAVLAAMPATAIHAVSGLCTAMFSSLVVWLFVGCAGYLTTKSKRSRWLVAASALLLGLARPEGNLVAGFALLATGALCEPGERQPFVRTIAFGYLLPGAIWFFARWCYYGLPLPLPIYVKMTPPGSFGTHDDGLAVALRVWQQLAWALVLAAVPGLWWCRRAALPAIVASLALFAAASMPSQIMGYCWRYQFPALPALAVSAGVGCAVVALVLQPVKWPLPRFLAALVPPALLLVVASGAAGDEARRLRAFYAPGLQRAHVSLGRFLRAHAPEHRAGVLAIGDAGAAPYYSDWRTVDTFGLNDPDIARSGRHDPERVLARAPDVLVLISKSAWQFLPWLTHEGPLRTAAMAAGMKKVNVLCFGEAYYLWVLARPGAIADALAGWRPAATVPDPFTEAAATDAAASLRPLGLRYGDLELVDCVLLGDGMGLRTRGPWDSEQAIVVLTLATDGDTRTAQIDCRPDRWLPDGPDSNERIHMLSLPRPLRAGDVVKLAVVQPRPPYPRLVAADGRTGVELQYVGP